MTKGEAVLYLRAVARRVRSRLVADAPLVVRMIERQAFGVPRNKKREALAYIQLGRTFGWLESGQASSIASRCDTLRDGYNVDDPRLESFPVQARPYMVTASRAAAADCRDVALGRRDQRLAQVSRIDEALAVLGTS